jgi:hypothetical protein
MKKIKKPQTDGLWGNRKPAVGIKKIKKIITRKEKGKKGK